MQRLFVAMLLAAVAIASTPAFAVQPDEVLRNPQLETRARALSRELRCMVCQNQSIDDSDAPLARDLRILVRERLVAGDSDSQVLDFLVNRYGEFVLLRPRFQWQTVLLWLTPILVLLLGVGSIVVAWRRASRAPRNAASTKADALSPAEEARLAELANGSER
jgi:cytochrome c-type biogenesis protein CcmH